MESTKLLCIPQTHEPAKVVGFNVGVGDSVSKLTPVLTYEYKEKYQDKEGLVGEDVALLKALKKAPDAAGYMTKREYLRSPFEGKVTKLLCKLGDDVQHTDALIEITRPCSHSAVFNGLCALCGKDVSEIDFTGVPETQAKISMFHDDNDLKVSYDMAASIDADTRERLWGQEKLSLIIDLDLTIIHATTPPNPGFESWLIENYDGPRSSEPATTPGSDGSADHKPKHTTLPDDIVYFDLPVIPSRHFIKLRPGLREFLETLSKLYEMHIYTMGTRSYADAVAKVIDPECKYFNGRILSRDENGSRDRKSLRRLFPVDTSMVVIIDDRADVWDWSPNLIRVHQYEFFTGVGDINAAHLPPVQQHHRISSDSGSDVTAVNESTAAAGIQDDGKKEEGDESADSQAAAEETTTPSAEEQLPEWDDTTGTTDAPVNDAVVRADVEYSDTTEEGRRVRRPHLVDNDRELATIREVLVHLHEEYYENLDPSHDLPPPDVARILSLKKAHVLNGASLAFTGVFLINPGSPPPQKTDLWIWAQNFGARCELEVSDRTTHVIAGKPGTEKVHAAKRLSNKAKAQGGCAPIIVKKEWLLHSIYRWEWLDETPHLWFADDKELAIRSAEARKKHKGRFSDSPVNKRKSVDEADESRRGDNNNGDKKKRIHGSTLERLKRQVDRAAHEYDSANTTDIEDELERQEAGLGEHEAEVDDFVQNIDWDDLEREIMEDTDESDGNQSSSESHLPSAVGSRTPSHGPGAADLRQRAIKQASKRRRPRGKGDGSGSDEDDGDGNAEDKPAAARKDGKRDTNRRVSNLARADGSLDISTNTEEESDDDDEDHDGGSEHAPHGARDFWADKIKMPSRNKSILDEGLAKSGGAGDKTGDSASNNGDDDDEFESDPEAIDEPLFVGVEDKNGDYIHSNGEDENEDEDEDEDEFVSASVRDKGKESAGGYQSDGDSANEQWGEDDESDEDNFDDLINDLEEGIESS
ncbi:CTD phosphatase Fcp1 [Coemansia sp. Benny D160-2]|nr:CTD phosphatase Fcp1 [Coemansia sp. Benny D160-2]